MKFSEKLQSAKIPAGVGCAKTTEYVVECIRGFCDDADLDQVPCRAAYDLYVEWCVENDKQAVGIKCFGRCLRIAFPHLSKTTVRRNGKVFAMYVVTFQEKVSRRLQ